MTKTQNPQIESAFDPTVFWCTDCVLPQSQCCCGKRKTPAQFATELAALLRAEGLQVDGERAGTGSCYLTIQKPGLYGWQHVRVADHSSGFGKPSRIEFYISSDTPTNAAAQLLKAWK